MTTLPHDILATIIDDLVPSIPEENATLRALSLTSRLLTPLCQRLLFRRIQFRTYRRDVSKALIPRFAALLSDPASLHLAEYVQHLSYAGRYDHIGDTLSSIAQILEALSALRSLHFSWLTYPGLPRPYDFDYTTLAHDPSPSTIAFCAAILGQLRSAHLTELRVPSMRNFPFASFIDKASMLDLVEDGPISLSLSIVQLRPDGVRTPQSSVHVRRYSVGASHWPRRMMEINVGGRKCLRSPSSDIPPLDLSNTKVMLLCAKEQINVVEAEKVLRCATGLEELSYEVSQASWFRNLAQTLLSSSSINTLTTLDLSSTSEDDPNPLTPILEELTTLTSSPTPSSSTVSTTSPAPPNTPTVSPSHPALPALQHLSLSLPLDLTLAPLHASALRKLDALLTGGAFPRLKSLSLHLILLQNAPWEEVMRVRGMRRGEGEGEEREVVEHEHEDEGDGNEEEHEGNNAPENEEQTQATVESSDPALPLPSTSASGPEPEPSTSASGPEAQAQIRHSPHLQLQLQQPTHADPLLILSELEQTHLACLPSISAAPGVEVHYSSVLRVGAAYSDDLDVSEGGGG